MKRKRFLGILAGAGLTACLIGCGAGGGTDNVAVDSTDSAVADGASADKTAAVGGGNAADDTLPVKEENGEAAAENAVVADETEKINLQGMGMSIVGDSLSAYDGFIPNGFNVFYPFSGELTDVSQTWWRMLLDETGMELCANNSSAGSTCAGDSMAEDIQCGCSSFRLSFTAGKQGKMPDIIIVYMGTNDLLDGIPVGDNDGTGLVEEGPIDNFSDAYCMMLDKLESEYPIAEIYCCTLAQVGDWGEEQPFVTFENNLGLTAGEYSERIRQIAEKRGMHVIDLYDCGIEIDNLPDMTSDGVHLTPEGMKCVENAILKALTEPADGSAAARP